MKSKYSPFLRLAIAASLAFVVSSASASAGTQYWTGAGEWTDAKWSNTSGGTYNTAWTNTTADVAVFEGTGGIVTIANNINADRLDFNVTGYSLSAASAVTVTGLRPNYNLAANVTATIGGEVTLQASGAVQSWNIKGGNKTTSILNVEGVIQNATQNFNTIYDSTVNLKTGGQLNNGSSLIVGTTTTGSGAALNVEGTLSVAATGSSLILNNTTGITADSSITLSDGGSITFTDTGNTNGIRFGPTSNTSGAATQLTGTLNLDGGTVTVNKIFVGGSYSGGAVYNSHVNLNGGTLKALRDQVDFMEGLTRVNVQAGGAIFDTNGKNITVSQAMLADSVNGGLEKKGVGRLTLDAASTYTGATTISEGTLAIGSGGSIASSSQVIVGASSTLDVSAVSFTLGGSAAQTLGGNGNIAGNMTVGANGTLSPGNSIGTLGFGGDLTLLSGSINFFEIDTAGNLSDLVSVSGLLTLGGTLNVSNIGSALVSGDTFNLFDWGSVSGTFSTVNLPGLDSGLTWDQSQLYTSGTLSVIPEPSSALLGSLAALVLIRRRR
jgi:autotransporter-associated beta strand protein